MNKFLLTITTFIYLMVSTGIAMDIHFCMNERVGAELFANKNEKCGRCGMTEKETGCCHDEHKFYKLEIPGKQVSACTACDFLSKTTAILTYDFSFLVPSTDADNYLNHIQPIIPKYSPPRLYIFQCVYRL